MVNVTSLPPANVYLFGPGAPEFAQAIDPHRNTVFDGLLPYSALLSKKSSKRIDAYDVRWVYRDENGAVGVPEVTIYDSSRFPSASSLPAHSFTFVTNLGGLASATDSKDVSDRRTGGQGRNRAAPCDQKYPNGRL